MALDSDGSADVENGLYSSAMLLIIDAGNQGNGSIEDFLYKSAMTLIIVAYSDDDEGEENG